MREIWCRNTPPHSNRHDHQGKYEEEQAGSEAFQEPPIEYSHATPSRPDRGGAVPSSLPASAQPRPQEAAEQFGKVTGAALKDRCGVAAWRSSRDGNGIPSLSVGVTPVRVSPPE